MSTVIRISDRLATEAKTRSKVERRSMTSWLEYRASIGKAAEDNPDLISGVDEGIAESDFFQKLSERVQWN